jgi:hypothetical protein
VSYAACPDALYGQHGLTDTRGRCPYCGHKVDSSAWFSPDATKRRKAARAQDPLSIDPPDEGDYWDGFGEP